MTRETDRETKAAAGEPKQPHRLLWSLVSALIAAATVYAVVSQSRAFSLHRFAADIVGAAKPWMLAATLCMLGFIWFEGEALGIVCRAFGYTAKPSGRFAYATSDIYFSAITPSATGGQPACAFFMMRDGIPATVTTLALLVNLSMYTLSILVIGLGVLVVRPGMFFAFGLLSRVFIVAGCVVQCLLAAGFLTLILRGDLLYRLCRGVLHVLCRIRLMHHEARKEQKLQQYIDEYVACAKLLWGQKRMLVQAFFCNLLQRLSMILIPAFVFLALGGGPARVLDVWALQCYTVIGTNTIPIPGAMGVSDYMLLDGCGGMMPPAEAVHFELLSRSFSFYLCVLLCGITTLAVYLKQRKQGKTL